MTYEVCAPSHIPELPGPRICKHKHDTIQSAYECGQDISKAASEGTNGHMEFVIYDVETERILNSYEVEDAYRQNHDFASEGKSARQPEQ